MTGKISREGRDLCDPQWERTACLANCTSFFFWHYLTKDIKPFMKKGEGGMIQGGDKIAHAD